MGRYTGKTCRLLSMLVLTGSFFLVEIIVGYVTNSLALVGDSYHMLSDVVALLVGCASVRISKWHTHKNTFGWARAEVLGALVNAVFLLALCFTIFAEALQRLFHDEHIHEPELMLIVGGIGLFVNLIGLMLFHGHSHGHSHGGKTDDHQKLKESPSHSIANGDIHNSASEERANLGDEDLDAIELKPKIQSGSQLNMKGVFLHVLGDALGSVVVIISALVIKYVQHDWKYKVDPAMSMLLVLIILSTTIPLLKESALILLQTVPTHIQVRDLQEKLIQNVEGVLAVHEFHVWQLAGNRIIASAHIHCQNLRDYMRIAEKVKNFFHNEGIHSTTIQPEFIEQEEPARDCVLECGPDKICFPDTCCATKRPCSADPHSTVVEGLPICRQRSSHSIANSNTSVQEEVAPAATAASVKEAT